MICPYCEGSMELGTLQNRYTIAWFPGTKKHISCNPDFYDGAVTIAKQSFVSGAICRAFFCRDCGKVIIDVENKDSEK